MLEKNNAQTNSSDVMSEVIILKGNTAVTDMQRTD
jgi:hypothetical protein